MIRLGYFIHWTPSKKMLVKMTTKKLPKLGVRVINSSGRVVGRVVDVIGPVKSPYAVVKPVRRDIDLKTYEELYIKPYFRRERK